jgi:tetratricopeptide (TPR) repeat protein
MNGKSYYIIMAVNFCFLAYFLVPVLLGYETLEDNLAFIVLFSLTTSSMIGKQLCVNYRFKKVNNLLSQQCDPDAYIEETQKLLDKATKRGQTASISVFRINLNVGLVAAGRFEEALAVMPDPTLFKNDRTGRVSRVTFHHNNFVTLLALGNMEQAALALAHMHDSLNVLKGDKLYEMALHHSQLDDIRFEMMNGHFENAEKTYRNVVDKAKSNIERVSAMLRLGETYQHYGRNGEAREAFEYVVAHGNKLYAVTLAKQHLASLGAV